MSRPERRRFSFLECWGSFIGASLLSDHMDVKGKTRASSLPIIFGMSKPTRIPRITIATISSMNVKPRSWHHFFILAPYFARITSAGRACSSRIRAEIRHVPKISRVTGKQETTKPLSLNQAALRPWWALVWKYMSGYFYTFITGGRQDIYMSG